MSVRLIDLLGGNREELQMPKLDFYQRIEVEHVLEHELSNDPDAAAFELVALRAVARSALAVVKNPAWCGVCDEDVALESALTDADLLPPNNQVERREP